MALWQIESIVSQLKHIAANEGMAPDDDALVVIARKADGSMRDAQSIFDQVRAFCGESYSHYRLTCDHITPMSRGGRDTWMNVVTACRACNQRKGSRTPEEAHMQLLYAPYIPNRAEFLILANRRILADQMEFLKQHVSANSRLHT